MLAYVRERTIFLKEKSTPLLPSDASITYDTARDGKGPNVDARRNIMTKSVVIGILAFGGVLAAVSPALATEVTYTTTGSFSVSGTDVFDGSSHAGKTATVTYNSYSGDDVLPSTDALGTFTVSAPPGTHITGGGTFLLTLDQTIVGGASGTGSFAAAGFSGTLQANGSGGLNLTFAQTSLTIDKVTYTLQNLGGPGNNVITFGKGGVTLVANITSPVPEPTFFGLTGLGLLGLGFVAIRQRKQRETETTP
jgi:hypothetical protein